MSDDSSFQVYYGGKFEVAEGNRVSYVGGEVHTLVCKLSAMFTNLMDSSGISLYGQRIWYKMPYEPILELKLLCNGGANFKRMCEAAMWTRSVDIFMEKEDVGGDEIGGKTKEPQGDSERNEEEGEMREVEARIEENVADFVDEDEHENSEGTPQNSDNEEDRSRCGMFKQGKRDITLGQVFDSIAQFKDAVVEYALKAGCNVKFTRWETEKSEVRCSIGGGCPFKIYCSYEKPVGRFKVKTFNSEHMCISDGYSKVLKGRVIANLLLNDIRKDPDLKSKAMQEALEEKHNLIVSNDQCRKAKKHALAMIQDEHNEQFARIKDYKQELLHSNPDSTVEVNTITTDGGAELFDKFYVSFVALKRTWLAHYRPIIGIDGCFLKNNVKGQLLAAVGRDANNQFFPVAWVVVKVENTDSWLWFIRLLKHDLHLQDGTGFTVISDRQKGLINAVEQELPRMEHRMCARHIYGNLRRVYPGKELPKDLFWAIAKSFNIGEYEKAIKALKSFDVGVYEAMMQKNPRNCSRAFFTCTSVCEDVSNNFSESYNNTINKAREMPLIEMLETIRRQAMIRMDIRRGKAHKHQGKYSPKVTKTIKEEEKHIMYCRVIPSGNGIYEVTEHNHGFTVNINARTCACRRWTMTGIPCRHALRVILYKKLDHLEYVSYWYLTSTWRKQYSDPIMPVNGINFWTCSIENRVEPPEREANPGPKKKQKRVKGKNESPKKKKKGNHVEENRTKLTRDGRTFHCGRCGVNGHNTRSCRNYGCPVNRAKKQPASVSGQGECTPSQQSQPSPSSHFA